MVADAFHCYWVRMEMSGSLSSLQIVLSVAPNIGEKSVNDEIYFRAAAQLSWFAVVEVQRHRPDPSRMDSFSYRKTACVVWASSELLWQPRFQQIATVLIVGVAK